jgi:hemerythrin-like metal-binding protein
MAYFEWNPALETGNDAIDEQHRSLFALASALQEAIESEHADEETTADCVWRLTDYVVQHFGDEEEMMAEAGYPGLGPHRSLHQHLTAETMSLTARFVNGEEVAPATLAPFLTRWLTDHISSTDMRFVAFLNARD